MDDILLNSALQLKTVDGDFVIGESTQQHQQVLLVCEKGSFKENPTLCVGARKFLENENTGELLREIRLQFAGDGMDIKTLAYEGSQFQIDAEYK